MSFLYVGHTHEDIDASFSRLADKLRRNEAETLPRLTHLLQSKSFRVNFDIKKWITPCINKIAKHTKPLHFRFSKDEKNEIIFEYKGRHNRPWTRAPHTMVNKMPKGTPNILMPENMDKINFDDIEKNVENCLFLFKEQSQVNWWRRFLKNMKEMKRSKEQLRKYASEGADWVLPKLPKQRKQVVEPPSTFTIAPDLQNMLDQELEDPQV